MRIPFWVRCLVIPLFLYGLILNAAQSQQPGPVAPDASSTAAPTTIIPSAPDAVAGQISGTVLDIYGDVVIGATVVLEDGAAADQQSVDSDDNGFFRFAGIKPGVTYHVTVHGRGFLDWTSQAIVLKPGQFFTVTGIQLKISAAESVTVYADNAQIATEQVQVAYQQKVLGFIPNYYVVYPPSNGQSIAPLPAKLKFEISLKFEVNPITFGGSAVLASVDQAAKTSPNYPQGWKGYAERVGANYADGFTDILFGGAVLPSLLHQDPRYYYQGTGTNGSRLKHALAFPFICKGDNGKTQPNYSSMGGDLISASMSNLYYPVKDRGAGLVFKNFAVGTGVRSLSTVLQEFLLRRLTPSAKKDN